MIDKLKIRALVAKPSLDEPFFPQRPETDAKPVNQNLSRNIDDHGVAYMNSELTDEQLANEKAAGPSNWDSMEEVGSLY